MIAHVERRVSVVVGQQPLTQVAQPCPFTPSAREPDAIVLHRQQQAIGRRARRYANRSALQASGESMFQRVLNQRLQDERR